MGYDLKAKKSDLEEFHFGAFSWAWLLDEGVGLAIKTGPGLDALTYYYEPDENGHSPQDNDGYYVTEEKAKMMAELTRSVVFLQQKRRESFNKKSEEEQKTMRDFNLRSTAFRLPVREDFVEKAEKFAEWADKSGGFTIH
jgi:hypothetical protein